MSEWQPIETAPKNGTPIICFTPDENFSEKTGFDLIWWEPSEGAWFYGAADFFSASPTHWMPLPRSPQSGAPAQPSRAADRIEALEAALREIAESARDPWQSIARAALAQEQDK